MFNVGIAPPINIGAQAQATPASAAPLERPGDANAIILGAFTGNVTFTLDGSTTPTATVGFTVKAGEPPITVWIPENATLKVFSSSGTLNYQWVRF